MDAWRKCLLLREGRAGAAELNSLESVLTVVGEQVVFAAGDLASPGPYVAIGKAYRAQHPTSVVSLNAVSLVDIVR